MELGVMLAESLARMEYLLAVGAPPCKSLLVELLLMRLPIRFRF
jgi:hypothetical protein